MPSEEPLNIPGLPIGWKFGDPMPEGTPVEEEKPPENQNPLEVVSKATNAKKKRRPKQPLIFEVNFYEMGCWISFYQELIPEI